jgi:hypothetical protein
MIHMCYEALVELIGPNSAMGSWEPEPAITPTIIG